MKISSEKYRIEFKKTPIQRKNLKMLIKEVEWCSIDQWYPLFKKVTFKTIILPLPNEVLEYLRSDGSLILPQECTEDENTEDEIESENDGGETEPYIKLGDGGEGAAQSSFVLA